MIVAELGKNASGEDWAQAGHAGDDRGVVVRGELSSSRCLQCGRIRNRCIEGTQVGQCLCRHRGLDAGWLTHVLHPQLGEDALHLMIEVALSPVARKGCPQARATQSGRCRRRGRNRECSPRVAIGQIREGSQERRVVLTQQRSQFRLCLLAFPDGVLLGAG